MVGKKKGKRGKLEWRKSSLEEEITSIRLPGIDWSLKNTVVLSILIVVLFSCAFLFYPIDLSFKTEERAAPLVKTSSLQLLPGEKYVYKYAVENSSFTVEYDIVRVIGGCTLVNSVSSNLSIRVDACIKQDGMLAYAKAFGEAGEVNLTALDFFQEWMLALNENWTWSKEIIRRNEQLGIAQSTRFDFAVAGVRELGGRKAFVVRIVMRSFFNEVEESSSTQEWLVDAEKRVLLYTEVYGGKIELISAPFELTSMP